MSQLIVHSTFFEKKPLHLLKKLKEHIKVIIYTHTQRELNKYFLSAMPYGSYQ